MATFLPPVVAVDISLERLELPGEIGSYNDEVAFAFGCIDGCIADVDRDESIVEFCEVELLLRLTSADFIL